MVVLLQGSDATADVAPGGGSDAASPAYSIEDLYNKLCPASWLDFAHRLGITSKDLQDIRQRGLTHKEADMYATRCSYMPYQVWDGWLCDDSLDAVYDPSPPCRFEYDKTKYMPGGLKSAIMELANFHLGEPISPASVAHELGRSYSPSIWVQMRKLVASGHLDVYTNSPSRYILHERRDDLGVSAHFLHNKEEMRTRYRVMQVVCDYSDSSFHVAEVMNNLGVTEGQAETIYGILRSFREREWIVPIRDGKSYYRLGKPVHLDYAAQHYA